MLESCLEIRVEWGHCDPARIVYNPTFHDWMEHGLTALFEAAGLDLSQVGPDFLGLPVVRAEVTFHAPARVGERIAVTSRVSRFGRTSLDVAHRFERDGALLVEAAQTRVWAVARDGDPDSLVAAPVPDAVRSALSADRATRLRLVRTEE